MSSETQTTGTAVGSRHQIALAGVLALVLIGLVGRSALKSKKADAAPAPVLVSQIADSSEDDIAELIASLVRPADAAQPHRLASPPMASDPFAMPQEMARMLDERKASASGGESLAAADELTLKGIFIEADGRAAFVNDRVVQPGDVIEGYEIVRIEDRLIVVRRDGREAILALPEPALNNGDVR